MMQLAIDIAKGAYFEFISQNEQKNHSPLKVLYIDLEMKIRELKERLKNIDIPTNLLWESEINSIGSLISYIRENIKGGTECVVILDNLKKMAERSTNHHEVNDIFRALKKLQKEFWLDFSKYAGMVVGLPYNIPFKVRPKWHPPEPKG